MDVSPAVRSMEEILPRLPEDLKSILLEFQKTLADGFPSQSPYYEPGWKGYRYSLIFTAGPAKAVYEDYEFPENSVILSSFPKTGYLWMTEVLHQILFGSDETKNALMRSTNPLLYRIEAGNAKKMEILKYIPTSRHVFRTHLPAPLINLEKVRRSHSKIIVPVRNPKDTAVSWYHFSKGRDLDAIREYLHPEWSQFFLDYIQGKQPIPVTKPEEGYAEFLRGWDEQKDAVDILFVQFENMRRKPHTEIRRIAEFLDVALSNDQVSVVAERTSFDAMKAKQDAAADDVLKLRKRANHLRKGKVGSWKDTFTVAQSEMMDQLMAEKLAGTDIKFTY